jgi:hypothetical protein
MRSRVYYLVVFLFLLLPTYADAQNISDGNQNLPPFGSFSGSDFDIVSLQNGNLHIEIPILTLEQRQGAVHRSYIYDTPSFTLTESIEIVGGRRTRQFIVEQNLLSGWGLTNEANWGITSSSISENCGNGTVGAVGQYTLLDPQGIKHPLNLHTAGCRPPITLSPTLDGIGAMVDISQTPNLVTLKDGTTIRVGTNLEDPNGNLSTTTSDNIGRTPFTVTQASTVTYTSPLGHTTSGPAYTTWTVIDSGGNQRIFRLDYTLVDIATSFCGTPATSPCTNFNSWSLFPAKLTLPNGTF